MSTVQILFLLTAGSPAFKAYFSSAAAIAPVGPLTIDTAGGDTMNSNTDDLGYNAATNQYLNIQFLDFPPDGIQYEVRVG
ncbi:MAG: hypothetical protein NTX03_01970 [Bacteroidetes bacterium]|nr:hypothetical protein [Bacteroidota bacterium]